MFSLKSISWRYKLILLVLFPAVIAVGSVLITGYTLNAQNQTLKTAISASEVRQNQANLTLVAIMQLQRDLLALIASDERGDIRENAIATIRATSVLDEQIQLLEQAMPGDEHVVKLKVDLENVKPLQMNIISEGKRNQDEAALTALKNIKPQAAEIIETAKSILERELQALSKLAARNEADNQSVLLVTLFWTLSGLVVAGVFAIYLIRNLLRSMNRIQNSMGDFSEGKLGLDLNDSGRDEIAKTFKALRNAVQSTNDFVEKLKGQSIKLKEGSELVKRSAHASSETAKTVTDNVGSINKKIDALQGISEDVHSLLDKSTEDASNTAKSCAFATEKINESIRNHGQFEAQVNSLSDQIRELSEAASSITNITGTIQSVSEQTNLLALNAAIEAARAGEQGRGFAVVADEVRSLANRSGQAVQEISSLARTMTDHFDQVLSLLNVVNENLDNNVNLFKTSATEITKADDYSNQSRKSIKEALTSNELQRRAINDIHDYIDELKVISESSLESVTKLDDLSNELSQSSTHINSIVAFFKP